MGWKTKLLLDTVTAATPFRSVLRHLSRRVWPYQTKPEVDRYCFEQGLEMVQLLREAGVKLAGKTALELGTGWHPVIPVLFYIAGVRKIYLTDLERLTDARLMDDAISYILSQRDKIGEALGLSEETIGPMFAFPRERSLEELLSYMNMEYVVPFSPSRLEPNSLDIIFSRAVLEHIPPKRLEDLLGKLRQSLRRDGVMCHIIDESDHWEHDDKGISRVNFLKFSEPLWSLTGINRQSYQNRLRHYEFRAVLTGAGLEVVKEIGEPDPDALEALKDLRVCRRYRDVPHEELAILTSSFVARPSSG